MVDPWSNIVDSMLRFFNLAKMRTQKYLNRGIHDDVAMNNAEDTNTPYYNNAPNQQKKELVRAHRVIMIVESSTAVRFLVCASSLLHDIFHHFWFICTGFFGTMNPFKLYLLFFSTILLSSRLAQGNTTLPTESPVPTESPAPTKSPAPTESPAPTKSPSGSTAMMMLVPSATFVAIATMCLWGWQWKRNKGWWNTNKLESFPDALDLSSIQ